MCPDQLIFKESPEGSGRVGSSVVIRQRPVQICHLQVPPIQGTLIIDSFLHYCTPPTLLGLPLLLGALSNQGKEEVILLIAVLNDKEHQT